MGIFSDILTIARWEVKKSFSTMGRNVLPLAVILFILLIAATGFVARSGMHLQDGMYTLATDDPELGSILASDPRFIVFVGDTGSLLSDRPAFDLVVLNRTVLPPLTDRGGAALKTLNRDYARYVASVYNHEPDLFAAYPLWIDLQYMRSELDFQATQSGQYISVRQRSQAPPVPEGPVVQVPPPSSAIPYSAEELRGILQQETGRNDQVARYTNLFTELPTSSNVKTPSQLSPSLPFDSIIFVFVFIFPLYFTSQFFMMSVMNERIERKGEILLSSPVHPSVIIAGKMLPYLVGMLVTSTVVILTARASLLILQVQSTGFSATDYLYSTTFFYMTSGVLLFIGVANFNAERLFDLRPFLPRLREFISSSLSLGHPYWSLLLANLLLVPFVFMLQMMALVLLFNLPLPLSLVLLILLAAFVEELAKSVGLYSLFAPELSSLGIKTLVLASAVTAAGFLLGEKLFLLAMLSQITESVFGSILFLEQGILLLWMPLLLHFTGVLIVALALRAGGGRWYLPGILAATAVHALYNLSLILGVAR